MEIRTFALSHEDSDIYLYDDINIVNVVKRIKHSEFKGISALEVEYSKNKENASIYVYLPFHKALRYDINFTGRIREA